MKDDDLTPGILWSPVFTCRQLRHTEIDWLPVWPESRRVKIPLSPDIWLMWSSSAGASARGPENGNQCNYCFWTNCLLSDESTLEDTAKLVKLGSVNNWTVYIQLSKGNKMLINGTSNCWMAGECTFNCPTFKELCVKLSHHCIGQWSIQLFNDWTDFLKKYLSVRKRVSQQNLIHLNI